MGKDLAPREPARATGASPILAALAWAFFLVLCLLAPVMASDECPKRHIVVGADQSYPPYEFMDASGNPSGFNIEIIKAVAEAMDLNPEIRMDAWSTVRQEFESGNVDVLSGMFYSEERNRLADFSVPHIVVTHSIFVRKDSSIKSLDDLKGKEIIVEQGDIMHDFIRENRLTDRIVTVSSPQEGLRLLASGQHDCALFGRLQGMYLAERLNLLSRLTTAGSSILPRDYCLAVANGNAVLLAQLNEGLSIIKNNGTYRHIRDKWFGVYEKEELPLPFQLAAFIVFPFTLLLAVIWFWNWSLKRQVRQRTEEIQRELAVRRRVEDALRASDARYEELVRSANSIILRRTPLGSITFFNEFAQAFFDYTENEIRGRNVIGTIVPETDASGQNLKAMIEDIGRHPERYVNNQNENMRRDGSRVWVAWTNRAIRDEEGNIVEILCIGNDITKLKRIEEQLRQSEEKYRTLIDHIQDGVFIIQDETIRFANDAFARLIGRNSAQEAIGLLANDVLAPDGKEEATERHRARMAGKEVESEYEVVMLHRDGKAKIEANVTVGLVQYQGRPAVLGTCKDITERKRVEKALRESEERYRQMADLLPQPVFEMDLQGKVTFANRTMFESFHYTPEDLRRGVNVFDVIVPEDHQRLMDSIHKRLAGEKPSNNQYTGRRRNGSTFPIIAYSSLIVRDDRCVGLRGIVIDITERRKVEEELLRAQKLESIGVLAGGLAHDFNNILTAIIGNVSLARMQTNPADKVFQRLEATEKACFRAKDLTQQLLTFSKGGKPVKKTLRMGDLIRESVTFALRGSNVMCEFAIADDLRFVDVDEGQMNQVLNNLAINADQAMPDGGVIRVTAENVDAGPDAPPPLKPGRYVRISIEDHGGGIPQEHLTRIFDPYFTTKQTGSGLGLATAYSVINKHNGCLTLTSQLGRGTTFHIHLPASEHESLPAANARPRPLAGSGRILIMDDEDIVREVLAEFLNHLGYEHASARNGFEAIALYRQGIQSGRPYDVVIMDLTIPGSMGGKEAVGHIREIDPKAKAIASSGYSNDPIMSEYKEHGFCGVLGKPYRIEELGNLLHRLTNGLERAQ
ncbi:MAG: PAS domain S-box protein [Acidobacteriota bacterium]